MKLVYLLPLLAVATAAKPYEDYVLVDMVPETLDQLHAIQHIEHTMKHLDFWLRPGAVGRRVRVMVKEDQRRQVLAPELDRRHISHQVADYDIQAEVDRDMEEVLARREARGNTFDINDFNTLSDINTWLVAQLSNCPTGVSCALRTLGETANANDIWAFSMSTGGGKSTYYIDSTIHGREWLAPATNLKLIEQFMLYGTDPESTALLDQDDYVFVVIVNPDGYLATWNGERLWRKNRRNNALSTCIGVDNNRNFDFRWGLQGASSDPCEESYRGPSAGSEPETAAVSDEITRLYGEVGTGVKAVISLHTYGDMWLFPWANTVNYQGSSPTDCELTADYSDLKQVADAACAAIFAESGVTWQCDTSCRVAGALTGSTDDWAKGVLGVKYPFTVQLRGASVIVSNDQIGPSFREVWQALKAVVNQINIMGG